jgi:hypothetical protein
MDLNFRSIRAITAHDSEQSSLCTLFVLLSSHASPHGSSCLDATQSTHLFSARCMLHRCSLALCGNFFVGLGLTPSAICRLVRLAMPALFDQDSLVWREKFCSHFLLLIRSSK